MTIQTNGKLRNLLHDENAMFPAFIYVVLTIFGMVLVWVALGPLFDSLYIVSHSGLVSSRSLPDIDSIYWWYSIALFFGVLGCAIWYIKQGVDKSKGF